MAELQLTNVVTISVSEAQAGIGEYNTSNLALFTHETPNGSFGTDGYKIYLEPTEVGVDFGTSSTTYKMALKVFSQKPNILAGGGYLVVIELEDSNAGTTEVQRLTPDLAPTSGSYKINFDGDVTGAIAYDASAATIQTAVRTLTGLGSATVSGTLATNVTITFTGYDGDAPMMTITENTMQGAGSVDAFITVTEVTKGVPTTAAESLDAAITRTKDLVQYFGIIASSIQTESDMLDAADVVQALNKIAFFVQKDPLTVESGGSLDLLRSGGFTQSRGLLYVGEDVALDSLEMCAAYAGRALSTDFSGSNTTQTMHLKDLAGIQPDSAMDQTLLNKAIDAGADTYVSLQGVPKVFTSGANSFFDDVYNLQWLVGALQVAGFNALATSSTKLPQTEEGVAVLKSAYRGVCEQALANQYAAPGTWTNATTFGNQGDFYRNIEERGYYIYSSPVASQSAAARAAREAPLIQIALKEAGAIHSSSVIVYVNV